MLYNLFFKHFLLSCVEPFKRENPKQDTPLLFLRQKKRSNSLSFKRKALPLHPLIRVIGINSNHY